MSLRNTLADFINRVSFDDFSGEVVQKAKWCVLDLIGVSAVGAVQKTSSYTLDLFLNQKGSEEATVWGTGRKVPILTAAFINAVQGHAIDMDDGHRYANGHPGVVSIPAAVAIAEKEDLSGRELIEAVVIGYEMFIRLGTAANPDLLLRGFHTTATVGTFASVAGAAKLLKLDQAQTENALSLAGLQSAGLLEALSSGEAGKSFQVGKTSQSGLLAALLAQKGADGPVDIFEGEKGFYRAFAGKDCDSQQICRNLGKDFHITETYCKQHAACRHIHTPLDATADIIASHDIPLEEISSIEIETYSIAHKLTGHVANQGSVLGAKFSTPVSIALFLVFGKADYSAYNHKYISDPRVQALARKIKVIVNPKRDENYPKERSALVTIKTNDQSYEHEMMFPKGEPESPLSDEEFVRKFTQNALVRYSEAEIEKIKDAVLNLENIKVRQMTEHLRVSS